MAGISLRTKIGYGVGHVLNDLCSAMWFTYLLIYFHHVLLFNNTLAGVVLLIGQVADGLSTPFVGHEADRPDDLAFCARYGRKKTWHLTGTLCVLSAFPFIFLGCLGCSTASDFAQVLYYAPFVIIFQFGWASTQISHLSLVPSLTQDPHERTELNALRYGFTVMSNITVYLVTWLVMGLDSTNSDAGLGPEDADKFRIIVFTVLAIGTLFSCLFHFLVKEENVLLHLENEVEVEVDKGVDETDCTLSPSVETEMPCSATKRTLVTASDWLKNIQFYQVALLYMGTRLFCNLTQAYVPIYLQDSLKLPEESVAYIPLVMYVAGFIMTTLMKYLNKFIGRKPSFIIGCILGGSACVCVYFGEGEMYRRYWLYAVASLMGAGASIMLVTSLSITADLIGPCVESGAFVYGAMSFTDKLSNGIAVMLIQTFNPCSNCCPKCADYFQDVLAYCCGGAVVIALIALLTLLPYNVGHQSPEKESVPRDVIEECTKILAVQPEPSSSVVMSSSNSEEDGLKNQTSHQVHTVAADYHGDVRARVVSLSSNPDDSESFA